MRETILCLLTFFFLPVVYGAEVELGFRFRLGTYTIPVSIGVLGKRDLTLDTGASYTVLDRSDIAPLALEEKQQLGVYLPHEGKRKPAAFVIVPELTIAGCVLQDRKVVVMDLPEGRPGALGMNDLEEVLPFTFTENLTLRFHCPHQ